MVFVYTASRVGWAFIGIKYPNAKNAAGKEYSTRVAGTRRGACLSMSVSTEAVVLGRGFQVSWETQVTLT